MIQPSGVPPEPPSASDEEMLAGALALMTAHAQASAEDKRSLAQSISEQVLRLARRNTLSADFKVALSVLAAHWAMLAADPSPQHLPEGDRHLWHPAPVSLQ